MSGRLPATFVKGFHDEEQVKRMEYRLFGKTGLEISKLAFGAGVFCSNYSFMEKEAIRTVNEALKSGINYIDTAPWYGQGHSESVLGKALQDVPRSAYYIATKVGRYHQDYDNMFDFSAKKVIESVSLSLKLLGLSYVDVIQIHDIEFAPNLDIVLNETLPALEQLVKEGKARHIGLSAYPVSVLKECISRANGRFHVVLSYSRYTLTDNTLLEYLDFLKSQKLGIICAAAHGMGLLTNEGPQSWHPATEKQKISALQASNYCKERGVELGKLAMWYTMQLDDVSTFLVGMQTRQVLQMNLDAIRNGLNEREQEVLQHLKDNILVKPSHWEGIEVERYRAAMERDRAAV
ncbi:L-galactose dehydrogenase [Drosophila grimshawi]|uniref:GH12681 n=1 Tax=Drosophila grimshawi TaxID=7222 RepID=B4JT72_DROGR|nr:L-galactose dehydrogenase [Drosophila grimshawi]EDV94962.1 GH12681 [Drosophila grimshawi]